VCDIGQMLFWGKKWAWYGTGECEPGAIRPPSWPFRAFLWQMAGPERVFGNAHRTIYMPEADES